MKTIPKIPIWQKIVLLPAALGLFTGAKLLGYIKNETYRNFLTQYFH